jgi:magnesium chelatase family protein
VVPAAAAAEARLVERVEVAPVETIGDVVEQVRSRRSRRVAVSRPRIELGGERPVEGSLPEAVPMTWPVPDLSEVRGQLEARRGLEIALAGRHGIVFVGPPGSGKTLLARTIPSLLPPLDDAAALEVTVVASAAGERSISGLIRQAPFRAPHHTSYDEQCEQ